MRRRVVPPLRVLLSLAAAVFVAACGWFRNVDPAPSVEQLQQESELPSDFQGALQLLQRQDVIAAERVFRQIASSCESGEEGRRSLLLMSALWLDQHPRAHPDSAAILAARFLSLPDADLLERTMARTIYLLALDMGADPDLRPARVEGPDALALTFEDCDQPRAPLIVALPTLDREPLIRLVQRLEAERDSVSRRANGAEQGSAALQKRVQELEAELQSARAEIERIRRLLGGRDTTTVRPRRR